jgi:hypothetical protein
MVAQVVGPNLLAFQFGNEPDPFRMDVRKSNYNPPDYVAEWREFLKALRTRVPGAPLAGPAIAFDTTWLAPFIHAFGSEVVLLTCHYYSEGPASSPAVTMERMLGSSEALSKIIDSVARLTAGSGLNVRSPCEATVANIESFLLIQILPKMNASALPRRGGKQPSCG